MRTHLILSQELVRKVDALVGKRKRSRFVEEAIREKLRREALVSTFQETAGVLAAEEYPEWATPQKVACWVRLSRQGDEDRSRRIERD